MKVIMAVSSMVALAGAVQGSGAASAPGDLEFYPYFCPPTFVRTECVQCQPTCENPSSETACTKTKCSVGCGCPEGKLYDKKFDRCVDSVAECKVEPKCTGGKVYTSCVSCIRSCNMGGVKACANGCIDHGCACPEDSIYDEVTDSCVPDVEKCSPVLLVPPGDEEEVTCSKPLKLMSGKKCNTCGACTDEERAAEKASKGCFCPPHRPYMLVKRNGTVKCLKKNGSKCRNTTFFQ